MILDRHFYSKVPLLVSWWNKYQLRKLTGDRAFKGFKLVKVDRPHHIYFYSPRLKRVPKFIGTPQLLSDWKDAKMCETICPTGAISVTSLSIEINERGCIACGVCVEFAPPGLLEIPKDIPLLQRS